MYIFSESKYCAEGVHVFNFFVLFFLSNFIQEMKTLPVGQG